MIRLIILLLGAQALHGQRRLLVLFGWLWIAAGALMLFDILQDGRSVLALDALAVILALEGLVAVSAALVIGSSASRPVLLKGLGFVFMAFLIVDVPADDNIVATVVFGSALLLDGAVRIASSTVIQHNRWKTVALAGGGEILLSLMILSAGRRASDDGALLPRRDDGAFRLGSIAYRPQTDKLLSESAPRAAAILPGG
ncbi:hypothetical protein AK51_14945 [Serratia nematodiphila DZ0503SBS1]|nr:hypothetical protein AK51_14945 [Serratia nematodiphila DZ0503SBS1]